MVQYHMIPMKILHKKDLIITFVEQKTTIERLNAGRYRLLTSAAKIIYYCTIE